MNDTLTVWMFLFLLLLMVASGPGMLLAPSRHRRWLAFVFLGSVLAFIALLLGG